ncbi:hypothetical protein SeLEV6574_g03752 [Synchytrium endobioticum]|uniref:Glutathione transferase n=1 Tax=Synchytrium endobioticum TaxID=286115 RepID=A0A507D2U4_9FUNG|nr:hypothetical protein SeLEV6574_g03752 [Synchytrium endobioticum]
MSARCFARLAPRVSQRHIQRVVILPPRKITPSSSSILQSALPLRAFTATTKTFPPFAIAVSPATSPCTQVGTASAGDGARTSPTGASTSAASEENAEVVDIHILERLIDGRNKSMCRNDMQSASHHQFVQSKHNMSDKQEPFITLYTAATPNGWKVAIALEDLGLPYKVHSINMKENEQKAPWYTKICPNGRIPAIVDHSKHFKDRHDGFAVFESGAILLYLAEHYDPNHVLLPADPLKRSEAIQWIMWQMGGLGPIQGQANHFARYAPETIEYAITRYRDETRRLYTVLDNHLSDGREYIIGQYSAADAMCIGWVGLHDWAGISTDGLNYLNAWVERMLQRPAVTRGLVVPSGTNPILNPPSAEERAKLEAGGKALIAQQIKENENKKGITNVHDGGIGRSNALLCLGGIAVGFVLGAALRHH